MIELKINGEVFYGWKSAQIKKKINAFSDFSLTVSGWYVGGAVNIPLDAECQVLIDNKPVITGYVDEISPNYSAKSHEISFSGRSKAAVLADCSALFETGQIMNADMQTIIEEIIKPFNVGLVFEAQGSFPVSDFQLQQGETAISAIERLCAMFSLVYFDDESGNLVISQVSIKDSVGTLIHKIGDGKGNNILSGSCKYSRRDRFSEYIVKSQTSGSDFLGGEDITGIVGRAVDDDVNRYRPIVLLAEIAMDGEAAQKRAEWEKANRAGKSISINYMRFGWYNDENKLWAPNQYVTVDDDSIQIKGKLIVSEISLSIADNGGTISSLTIAPPEAFIPITAKENVRTFTGWKELKEGV